MTTTPFPIDLPPASWFHKLQPHSSGRWDNLHRHLLDLQKFVGETTAPASLDAAALQGYPGNYGSIPKSAATIAEVLKQNGYNTMAAGK